MTNTSSRAAEVRRMIRVLHANRSAPMLRPTSHATRSAHRLMVLRFRREHARRLAKEGTR